MMPLCGFLNLSAGSPQIVISNCVRACTLTVIFLGISCRRLQRVAQILSSATRNYLLHEFSSRHSHSKCCPYGEFFFAVLFVLVIPRSTNCDGIGSKSQMCKFDLGFPRIEQNVEVLIRPKQFGELLLVLSRHKLPCEQFSSPLSTDNFFTTHSSSIDWYVLMA